MINILYIMMESLMHRYTLYPTELHVLSLFCVGCCE